VLNTQKEK